MTELAVQPPSLPDTWLTSDTQDARAKPEPLIQRTCQQCQQQASKYCCPACSFRSCSLGCSQVHKVATGCTGKRSRTAFVPLCTFSDRELLSDYRLLEETARAHDVAQRTKPPAPSWCLPKHLEMLRDQAQRRGIKLELMQPGMARRRRNSSRYEVRTRTVLWHLEWHFPTTGREVHSPQVKENTVLAEVLRELTAIKLGNAARRHELRAYADAGVPNLHVLLRREHCQANALEYYKLDQSKPLRTQLPGLSIVEYPTLVVLLPDELSTYKLAEAPSAQPAPPVEPSANPAQASAPPVQPQAAQAVESVADVTEAGGTEPKQEPTSISVAPVDAPGLSCDAVHAPCPALAGQDTPEAGNKCIGTKDPGCPRKQSLPAPVDPILYSK